MSRVPPSVSPLNRRRMRLRKQRRAGLRQIGVRDNGLRRQFAHASGQQGFARLQAIGLLSVQLVEVLFARCEKTVAGLAEPGP